MPYHIRLCHTIPYDTIWYHMIPYDTIWYHMIQYDMIRYDTIPYHTIQYHAMPCHAMPCHAMPCHAMPCHLGLLELKCIKTKFVIMGFVNIILSIKYACKISFDLLQPQLMAANEASLEHLIDIWYISQSILGAFLGNQTFWNHHQISRNRQA